MLTRIAVLVSGGGTNLQALLDAEAAGRLPDGHIALVISNKADAYALTRAERAGVPSLVIQAARGPAGQAEFEEKLQAALTENGISEDAN